jgi:hypothetical protein
MTPPATASQQQHDRTETTPSLHLLHCSPPYSHCTKQIQNQLKEKTQPIRTKEKTLIKTTTTTVVAVTNHLVEEEAAAMAATPEEAETAHAMTPTLKTVGEENSAQEGSREIARERRVCGVAGGRV